MMRYSQKIIRFSLLLSLALSCTPAKAELTAIEKGKLRARLFRVVNAGCEYNEISKIVKEGADVNAKDQYSRTVLVKVLDTFLKHFRVKLYQKRVVELLVKSGADVTARDDMGHTALMKAEILGNKHIIRVLKKAGATLTKDDLKYVRKVKYQAERRRAIYQERLKKSQRKRRENETPQQAKKSSESEARAKLFKVIRFRGSLLELQKMTRDGVNVNVRDNYNRTVLMLAVDNFYQLQKMAIINMLINAGADVNARDEMGNTALTRAMLRGNNAMVNLLKKAGAVASEEDLRKVEQKRKDIDTSRQLKKKENDKPRQEIRIDSPNRY